MSLTANLSASLTATQTSALDLGTVTFPASISFSKSLTSGVAANMADLMFSDTRTISASSTETLDLYGSLTDALGSTLNMVELVAVFVTAAAANTNNVVLGDATNPIPLFGGTNPTYSVKPGGVFFVAAPDASGLCSVSAGSHDGLKVANSSSGTSVTYSIVVLGRSA